MSDRVVDLVEHSRRQHLEEVAPPIAGRVVPLPGTPVATPRPLRAWDVDGVAMLESHGVDWPRWTPRLAVVRFTTRLDPVAGRVQVSVTREGWDVPTVHQAGYQRPQTREQEIRSRAQMEIIHGILASMFEVPA